MDKKLVCLLLSLTLLFLLPSGAVAAGGGEVNDVTRDAPATFSAGDEIEVTLKIDGDLPLIVGIVELLPEGLAFPENDADISNAKHFEVDRKAGKISFSAIDEKEIKYKVVASENGKGGFTGQWVDLLVQSPELDEGKERWQPVSDPNSIVPVTQAEDAESTKGNSAKDSKASPGPGAGLGGAVLFACVCLFRRKSAEGIFGKKFRGGKKL